MMSKLATERPKHEYWYQFFHELYWHERNEGYVAIVRAPNKRKARRMLRKAIELDGENLWRKYRYKGRHEFDWQKYRCRPAFDVISYKAKLNAKDDPL
jgi:hypothetical protein